MVSLLAKRERERERGIEGTCISESGRWSWSLYRTKERESISSFSSSASVSSSAPMTRGEDGRRGTDSLLPTGAEVDDRKGGKGEGGGGHDTARRLDIGCCSAAGIYREGWCTDRWRRRVSLSSPRMLSPARVSCTHTRYLPKEGFSSFSLTFFPY